jgi:excisionase family DNA binding protein
MSEPEPEYFTVSQAAARLGVSERTLRKRIKAGEVEAEKRPLNGGGVAWHVQLSPDRAGSEPEAERKNEPEARRKPFESESASERKRTGSAPETAPEVSDTRAGSEPEAGLIDQLRDENAFLRSQVDAWRLQAEAANRTASETATALRKALDAMPKGLPSGSTPDAEDTGRKDAAQAPQSAPTDRTPAAPKQSAQRRAKPRKLTAWQRIGARLLGIR